MEQKPHFFTSIHLYVYLRKSPKKALFFFDGQKMVNRWLPAPLTRQHSNLARAFGSILGAYLITSYLSSIHLNQEIEDIFYL
ncbi:hypothetical protein YK48G_03770 [Lentilactobacillus fungorum]|uniref:Uncharacterized protein n=1 Tax=Lentilactobacillus fungorum TaxID=2201250 RepID=A0ABQ3VVP3_9LACO|nr:hypothetical protein [Lentilactobacillus fungorum]GHP12952.1 hypothetical protein YK48G_03770 [Lentilactobacillus fungorum]